MADGENQAYSPLEWEVTDKQEVKARMNQRYLDCGLD